MPDLQKCGGRGNSAVAKALEVGQPQRAAGFRLTPPPLAGLPRRLLTQQHTNMHTSPWPARHMHCCWMIRTPTSGPAPPPPPLLQPCCLLSPPPPMLVLLHVAARGALHHLFRFQLEPQQEQQLWSPGGMHTATAMPGTPPTNNHQSAGCLLVVTWSSEGVWALLSPSGATRDAMSPGLAAAPLLPAPPTQTEQSPP